MTASHYQAFLRAKIEGAIVEAKAAALLSHQGVKGTVLEILVARVFRPLLPSDIGIGTGQIIDCTGRMSNQVDIVLYDREIMPPGLYDESTGFFPVVAVLYAIEVKTTLTRTELVKAHHCAMKLAEFSYLPGHTDEDRDVTSHTIERVRSVVFALSSKGASTGEAARYAEVVAAANEPEAIRAICVAGKEYCYDSGELWVSQRFISRYDEVLSFLGGVMNTYRNVSRSRGSPLLGHYIIPEVPTTFGPVTNKNGQALFHCSACSFNVQIRPTIQMMGSVTVNGRLVETSLCPECGGQITTAEGVFKFSEGRLIEGIVA
jgi:hypothetical protein